MKNLHESIVQESEIDSLGHMNVRFYIERAAKAHQLLLNELGVSPGEGQQLRRLDTHNRFHREQFAGATLHTYGGLVTTENNDSITGYYEIRNVEKEQVAATFIITSQLLNISTGSPVEIPSPDRQLADSLTIEIPEHGRPRSLFLNPPRRPTFEEVEPLIPDHELLGGMSGRREGVILEEDCDSSGRLGEDKDLVHVVFRPQPGEDIREMGPPHLRDEQGRLYSWAMMEIRSIVFERPRLGEGIISLSTDVNFGEKWRHSRRWIFSKDSGALLGISDQTGICMDLEARRAIAMPDEVREVIEANCLRDFA